MAFVSLKEEMAHINEQIIFSVEDLENERYF
jgi:hypothetical protein